MLAALPQPHHVASTMPSTSPMAHPVRQCDVADTACLVRPGMPAPPPTASPRTLAPDSDTSRSACPNRGPKFGGLGGDGRDDLRGRLYVVHQPDRLPGV